MNKSHPDLLKMPEQERRAYEKYLINRASEQDMIESAYDEGIEKGVMKGRVEVALNMLRTGLLTTDQITQVTGLSPEEIRKLTKKS